jgi:hypothetical protein
MELASIGMKISWRAVGTLEGFSREPVPLVRKQKTGIGARSAIEPSPNGIECSIVSGAAWNATMIAPKTATATNNMVSSKKATSQKDRCEKLIFVRTQPVAKHTDEPKKRSRRKAQLTAHNHLAGCINAVHLKDRLCDIQADFRTLIARAAPPNRGSLKRASQ